MEVRPSGDKKASNWMLSEGMSRPMKPKIGQTKLETRRECDDNDIDNQKLMLVLVLMLVLKLLLMLVLMLTAAHTHYDNGFPSFSIYSS